MNLTPAMQQFMKVKNEHPDCLLFFRMGDFYETFFDDAKIVSKALNIVLTARGNDRVPLAGIPYHSIDPYLNKLIKQGFKVAIVEQLEDPKKAKGLVKRGLVKIITPGTILNENALDEGKNNFLVGLFFGDKNYTDVGISAVDLSTGDFYATESKKEDAVNEIKRFSPSEILIPSMNRTDDILKSLKNQFFVTEYNDVFFYHDNAYSNLLSHFQIKNLHAFDLEGKRSAICACGGVIKYLKDTQMSALGNVSKISFFKERDYMVIDPTTIRNLELFSNVYDNTARGSLISAIDKTKTPMGSRKLKSWILRPLIDKHEIDNRLEIVEKLKNDHPNLLEIREHLKGVMDIQRLISRISNNLNCPKDLIGLKNSLQKIPKIKAILGNIDSLKDDVSEAAELIENSIMEESPSHIREGNFIKKNFSTELDELKSISRDAKKFILTLEEQERERTNIRSLKIRYNRVFGYYIEVTKPNLHLVPPDYIRKQTQVNSERFITNELKEKEDQILNSSERQIELEIRLYSKIIEQLAQYYERILKLSQEVAEIDVLTNFAYVSTDYSYKRPVITDGYGLHITNGRHPVIERFEKNYVPNDCMLDENTQMMVITGPNMSGKSSYMRQNALIILLAQAGCFVPADSAKIGIVDRLFSRIGAFDDVSSGQSTFMVEMIETANIVNNATSKSFIILDEIGRGTSTYDGISLASALCEYIVEKIKAKTLFATHYHQLNRLSEYHSEIKNYNVSVLEEKDRIVFLHKIEVGGTDKSYGIEVAKLAGLPKELIKMAQQTMSELEVENEAAKKIHTSDAKQTKLNFFNK